MRGSRGGQDVGGVFGTGGAGRGHGVDVCLCTAESVCLPGRAQGSLVVWDEPKQTFRAVVTHLSPPLKLESEKSSGCLGLLCLLLKWLSARRPEKVYTYIYIKLGQVHVSDEIKQLIEGLR